MRPAATKTQILLGTLPLLIAIASNLLLQYPIFPRTNLVGGYLFPPETLSEYLPAVPGLVFSLTILAGFAVGWARDFPRWSYSYLGYALLMVAASISSLLSIGALFSREWSIYSAVAWLPTAALVATFIVLAVRSGRSLLAIPRRIWHDWTLLSFAVYAIVTPVFIGQHYPFGIPPQVILGVVAIGGTAPYLFAATTSRRALALAATLALLVAVSEVLQTVPQLGRFPDLLSSAWSMVNGFASMFLLLFGLVFLPGLLGLLRMALSRRGNTPPAESDRPSVVMQPRVENEGVQDR
jgi:hypothetical protein